MARARRGRPRGPGRRRLLVPAQPRPHRQPAALVRPPRPDLPAGARPGARRPRSPQRPRLPDRRLGLVGLVPARPPPRPRGPLAAARSRWRSPASSLCLGRGARARCCGSPALVGLAAALAWLSPRPRPRAPTGCPAASSPACATWPRPSSSAWRCCPLRRLLRIALTVCGRRGRSPSRTGATLRVPSHRLGARPGEVVPRSAWLASLVAAIAIGYPVQRHYLREPLRGPDLHHPGPRRRLQVGAARSPAPGSRRPAPASTRCSAPTSPTGSSSSAQEQPHGGFVAPDHLPRLAPPPQRGDYDYVVATRDRIEPGKPPYPPTARWTEGPHAQRRPAQAAHGRLQAHGPAGSIGVP